MSTITLKDIPASLHRALRQQAKVHGRSLNKEIISCLEATVFPQPLDRKALLREIQTVREQLGVYLTDADLKKFKNEGRP